MSQLSAFAESLRPRQWVKNLAVFAALIFAHKAFVPEFALKAFAAFSVFCAVSGAVYLINDLMDYDRDRQHPLKSQRPIASGRLKKNNAILGAILLLLLSLPISWTLGFSFFICIAVYIAINLLYSTFYKKVVIIDLFCISSGFIIRVVAGGLVIDVPLSHWLLICTTLLALFLALAKRRHEIVFLEERSTLHREVLKEYSPYLLDQMISVVTASTVVTYSLYTLSEETVRKVGSDRLIFTIPFVLYGIFRYLYLIHREQEGGRPEQALLTDKPLLLCCIFWALTAGLILYR